VVIVTHDHCGALQLEIKLKNSKPVLTRPSVVFMILSKECF